jgi:hypothetical protein
MTINNVFLGGHNAYVPLSKGSELSYENFLSQAGFNLINDEKMANAAIFIEMNSSQIRSLPQNIPLILVRNEPIIVWPQNYEIEFVNRVSKLIDVGRFDQKSKSFIPWPQDFSQFEFEKNLNNSRSNRVAIISGNKLSFIPGELYSLRRKCIHKFSDLDIYGTSWDISRIRKSFILLFEFFKAIKFGFTPTISNLRFWFKSIKNYLGSPTSKVETLRKYKYSLVIENSIDYLTEKLFDAFFAGNIPIYVGPDVELFNIPKNLVIQAGPSLEQIELGISLARKMNYEEWLNNLNMWLNEPSTRNTWAAENVYLRIANEAEIFIRSHKK